MAFSFLLAGLVGPAAANAPVGGGLGGGDRGDRIEGKTKFLPLPYVDYDRSLSWAVGAIPILMFNPVDSDTLSPSSAVGAFGMYTGNKTWVVLGFAALYLKEDTWRITSAGGTGSINFQFYLKTPLDVWIPYNTAADFAYIGVDRRVWDDLFLGVSYTYTRFETTVDSIDASALANLHGIGLNASMDKRSNVRYPRAGFLSNLKFTTYPEFLSNEFVSNKIEFDYNHYLAFRDNIDVLAARLYSGVGIGDLCG